VKGPDGKDQKLRGLAEPGASGDAADVNEATTVLTTGLTDGLAGMLGSYDDPSYNRAVALVYQHIQADGLPDLQDKAATLAKLDAWKNADPELKKLFDALRADLSRNQPPLGDVLAKLAARDHQPTPGPIATPRGTPGPLATGTPTPTPVDTAAVPSPQPSAGFPPGFQDGPLDAARFNGLAGMAADDAGHLYAADANNHRVRLIDLSDPTRPSVTTVAGNGQPGNTDGDGNRAQFEDPRDVAFDGQGTLYVAENGGHRIRAIDLTNPSFPVTTIAGGQRGHLDANGLAAQFDHPVALAYDATTRLLYIAENDGDVVRALDTADPAHPVTTLAGQYNRSDRRDGDPTSARFNGPQGLALGPDHVLYVADTVNSLIRKITLAPDGKPVSVGTAAGVYEAAPDSTTNTGLVDGPATAARFNNPVGLAVDAAGNLLIADTVNKRVRRLVAASGMVETVAGPNLATLAGQTVALAFPAHVVADARGNAYLADLRLGQLFKLP
jgi:sugar lactone lactonase YvrE